MGKLYLKYVFLKHKVRTEFSIYNFNFRIKNSITLLFFNINIIIIASK